MLTSGKIFFSPLTWKLPFLLHLYKNLTKELGRGGPGTYFSGSTRPFTNQRCISTTTSTGGAITSSDPAMATFQ